MNEKFGKLLAARSLSNWVNGTMLRLQRVASRRIELKYRKGLCFWAYGSASPDETGRGHALQVGFPGAAAGLDLVGQVGLVHETIRAVAGNVLRAAAHQCDVVGQAGMADCEVIGQQHILLSQCVQMGHAVANHALE